MITVIFYAFLDTIFILLEKHILYMEIHLQFDNEDHWKNSPGMQ